MFPPQPLLPLTFRNNGSKFTAAASRTAISDGVWLDETAGKGPQRMSFNLLDQEAASAVMMLERSASVMMLEMNICSKDLLQ